jgi:large subunit ribosomal protein L22
MEILSTIRNVAMSPKKIRHVTRQIVGLPALAAKNALDAMPRKSSHWVAKTLRSAIANAENNNQLNPENLRVKEAVVGDAMSTKRWMPRARGGADTIVKRRCHIRIVLTDTEN